MPSLDHINIQTVKLAETVAFYRDVFELRAGDPPPPAELAAFCDRLNEITAAGGQLKLIQIYTVARRPAESYVAPLTDAEVDALAELVRSRTGLETAVYYGATS